MKILNLYAGIGGNRKLWGDDHEVTAIEYEPEVAKLYQEFFPADKVIVTDAHEYLLEHYKEFDFIWASPPCPTHSKIRYVMSEANKTNEEFSPAHKAAYPDMKLYEEILFLQGYFKGLWCVENVVSWYDPLIPPNNIANHYFWTNFVLRDFAGGGRNHNGSVSSLQETKGFDISKFKGDKRKALRNCVEPELAKHILDLAITPIELHKSLF